MLLKNDENASAVLDEESILPSLLGLSILVAGSNSWSLQASLFAQMVVEETASVKPDSITARILQQTEHLD